MNATKAATVLGSGLTTLLGPMAAQAHVAGGTGGFEAALLHPIGGLDHILAMIAVGLWAAQLGGRALWLVPLAFVATMLLGGALAVAGAGLPLVELGIAGSVALLGALVLLRARLPHMLCLALVGLFALFHGHAHGAEAPLGGANALYGLGIVLASVALYGAGIAAVFAANRLADRGPLAETGIRASGGSIALAGLALLIAA